MRNLIASKIKKVAENARAIRVAMGLAAIVVAPLTLGAASFQGLGSFPGGVDSGLANAVSADGKVIVGNSLAADQKSHAYYWTAAEGMVRLDGLLNSNFSNALGVSADGTVIAGEMVDANGYTQAFRWTKTSGMVGLGFIGSTVYPRSRATDVSDDGQVIVGDYNNVAGLSGSFRWTASAGMVDLGTLPSGYSFSGARRVSSDGSVIVGELDSQTKSEAYRWTTQTGIVPLGLTPLVGNSWSAGVSADGTAVAGSGSAPTGYPVQFYWTTTNGMVWFDSNPSQSMFVSDLSADGKVAVGSSNAISDAGRWTASGGVRYLKDVLTNVYGLDLTGWRLFGATGVSHDGSVIVGWANAPVFQAWRAEIPPQVPAAGRIQLQGLTDTTLSWTPAVFDPEGDALVCRLAGSPANGIATVASDCSSGTYRSKSGFLGPDNFSYVANDGKQDSNVAPVAVAVVAVLTPTPTYTPSVTLGPSPTPTATFTPIFCPLIHEGSDGTVFLTTTVNTPVSWQSNTVTTQRCGIISSPQNGTVTLTPIPGVTNTCAGTYTPNSGYSGGDSFGYLFIYYYEYQGLSCSQQRRGYVSVTVRESLTAAMVNSTAVSGIPSGWIPVASSPEGYLTTCRLGTPPANGTASVANDCSSGTYQSHPGFIGTDSFTYIANDGLTDSNPGTVTVAVTEPQADQACLTQYPVTQFSQTGKAGSISITFTGNITSHANKEVKLCPGTTLSYQSTSTQGPVLCKVKNNTTRGSGTLKINDHLKCTDKPAGQDKVHFKVKSGVK